MQTRGLLVIDRYNVGEGQTLNTEQTSTKRNNLSST